MFKIDIKEEYDAAKVHYNKCSGFFIMT